MAISGNNYTYSTFTNIANFINENFSGKLYAASSSGSSNNAVTIYKGSAAEEANKIMAMRVDASNTVKGYVKIYNGSTEIASTNISGNYNKGQTAQIFSSSYGLLIYLNSGNDNDTYAFISFNDDGDIIMGIKNNGSTVSADAPTSMLTYSLNKSGSTYSYSYTANSGNVTALCNMVADGGFGVDASAQYVYYMPIYQYSVPGIFTFDDEDYVSNGYWCIKD